MKNRTPNFTNSSNLTTMIVVFFALISVVACKQKETQPAEVTTDQAVEISNEVPKVDYASYGMKDTDAPKGLNKGAKAPEVTLTIDGEQLALAELYKDQKVALIFYRGYWCPACNKHLSAFAERAKELEDKGIKLIAITPETQEGIDKTKERTKASFTIVSDLDGSIQKAFDVDYDVTEAYLGKVQEKLNVAIAENNANGKEQLPVPATFLIDTNGEIVFAHFDPNYSKRASIDDIIAAL